MDRTLFVADLDMGEPGIVDGIIEHEHGTTRIAEGVMDALVEQEFDDQICSIHDSSSLPLRRRRAPTLLAITWDW